MNAWVIKRRQQKRQVSAIFVLLILFLLNNVTLGIINSSFLASYQQDGDKVSSLAYPLMGNTTTQMESVDRTSAGSILKTVESAQGDESGQIPPTIFIYTIDTSIHGTYIYDTEFKQLLESLGFSVIIEDRNSISLLNSSSFTNVSQFWLMNGDTGAPLEDSEVSLILDAWRNGTDIVLAGRNTVSSVNKISENFDVEFLGNVNTEVNHSLIFANHPIWINVTYLYTESPLPSLIIDPTSQAVNLSFLPAMWTLHALFENKTGKVFWESSCLHFKDDYIGFSDNAQYISNLARYLQEPEVQLLGAENNSFFDYDTPLQLQIIDDNLKNVSYNWDGDPTQLITDPFNISLPSTDGWNTLNIFIHDNWNHSLHVVYKLRGLLPHSQIIITSDMDFENQGWPGEGTSSNPYLIEGLDITSSELLIQIKDTSAYFVIKYNHLDGGRRGIELIKVNNGIIVYNDIHDCSTAIFLDHVNNIIISNNTIHDNSNYGINPSDMNNSIIYNNLLSYNDNMAIYIGWGRNNTVSYNSIFNNGRGIGLARTWENHILANELANDSHLTFGGINLYLSNRNNIINNTIYNTTNGFRLSSSENNNISRNRCIKNSNAGIYLESSSDNNTISENQINNSLNYGIYLEDFSSNNSVFRNTISNNTNYGILISSLASNNNMTENYFFENNILGSSQAYDDVSGNIFDFNHWDDWISPDLNLDEIVDYPYVIAGSAGNLDYHPLVGPYLPQIPNITLSSTLNNTIQEYGTIVILTIEDDDLHSAWFSWDNGFNQSFLVSWNVNLSLVDGWHWLTIYANDTTGRLTFKNYYFYCEADVPLITLTTVQNDTVLSPDTIINLTINYYSLNEVWYNWDGVTNRSFSIPYELVLPDTEGYHWLNVYANDSVGYLTVKNYRWWVNLVPTIRLLFPSNATIQIYSTIFVFMIADNNLDTTWFAWDDDINQSFTVLWNLTLTLADGWHWLTVYANDTYGATIHQRYYFYSEAVSPSIGLIGLENDTLISSETIIQLNITDFSLQTVLVNWDNSISQNLASPYEISVPATEGSHWLHVYANDSVGHLTVKNYRWWVNLVPTIRLLSPSNATIQKYGTTAVFTIIDTNLEATWFAWDNNDNQSFSVHWNVTLTLADGWHWLTVHANDTYGETTIRSYHFYCDGAAPIIELIGLPNNSVISSTDNIQLNVTEFLLESVWVSWDDDVNQTLDSSYIISTSIPEGYHWLTVYAIDSVGHLSWDNYRFFINYPPVILLQNPSNSSTILPTTDIEFSVTDFSLLTVWYQWDSEGNVSLSNPFVVIPINVSDWHTLLICANDSWGSITTKRYLFYILGFFSVDFNEPPSLVYSGEKFVYSFTITNSESVPLNLTLLVFGSDDEIIRGNGSQIYLAPSESREIILEVKPLHASIHQLIICLYLDNNLYYQNILKFDVKPQWQSPRFYIPFFSILLIFIILFIALFLGILTYFSLIKKDRTQPFLIEEFTPIKSPSLLKRIQIYFKSRVLYKRARGTLHLQTLKKCHKNMKKYLSSQESQKRRLINNLQRVERQEQKVLEDELSQYLIRERLIEAEGIGSVLHGRILQSGRFKHIDNLHQAIRYIYGIGEVKQEAISRWARDYKRQFPRLLQGHFPGKTHIVNRFQQQKGEIQGHISTIDHEFVRIQALINQLQREVNWLQVIKAKHFRDMFHGKIHALEQVSNYLKGVFPELMSPPEWFDGMVREFGQSQYNKIMQSQYRGFASAVQWAHASDLGFKNKEEHDRIRKQGFESKPDYNAALQLGVINASDFYADYAIYKHKVVDRDQLTKMIMESISTQRYPIKISTLSKEFDVSIDTVIPIAELLDGYLIGNVYYPLAYIDQIGSYLISRGTGSLTSLYQEFNIDSQILKLSTKRLLQSNDSIFTFYLNPDQDIFAVIAISDWRHIIGSSSSKDGFILGTILPQLTVDNWRSVFEYQDLSIFYYSDKLFTLEGFQMYAAEHLNEINSIIQCVRHQLPHLSLADQDRKKILQSFEDLIPIEPVSLPYYCQMDSSMIVKEEEAYVCLECNRKTCPVCYGDMRLVGRINCIHCKGDLVRRPTVQIVVDIERVDRMMGHEFEKLLEGLFRTQGYQVDNIQSSGDHGVDLVVIKGNRRTGVQAKRLKPSSKIGNKVLVTLKGSGYFHDCDKLMVVTTSFFTRKATEYAQKVGIELWDRDVLRRYLTKYNEHLQDISN